MGVKTLSLCLFISPVSIVHSQLTLLCATNAGGWFNYVATLTVVERLAGERGLLVSLVLIVRMLPSLLLFPVAGVVADRSATQCFCLLQIWNDAGNKDTSA